MSHVIEWRPGSRESTQRRAGADAVGEVPVTPVTLRDGADAVIAHVGQRIASYRAPDDVHVGELPRTPTGKLERHILRDRPWWDDG